MSNSSSNMRVSPVLLAVLTASAAFGFSRPVDAQTPAALQRVENTDIATIADPSSPVAVMDGEATGAMQGSSSADAPPSLVVPTTAEPETFPVDRLAQTPVPPSTQPPLQPGSPPPGTQTPDQGQPAQIQIDGDAPGSPNIEIDEPPTTPPPSIAPTPTPEPPQTTQPAPEPRVLVAEVVVSGVEGRSVVINGVETPLEQIVYDAIDTQAGRTTTRSQLQQDINSIFATGYFGNVRSEPTDTVLGVRVTFIVRPNPDLRAVEVRGSQVLPQSVIDEAFADQYGKILNARDFQQGIETLNQWYQDNGYVLAQFVGAPQISEQTGTVTLEVAEGVIEDIQVRFLNEEGEAEDEQGNPIEGQTREFIITREFQTQPGDVFNRNQIERDLQRAFALGIFEDVQVSLNPGDNRRQVDVTVNVTERNTGSIAAGLGFSSASGLFGTVSYQEQNLGGNNQRLGAEVQVGERELLFDVNFTDPWIAGDPYRTSYTVNAFGRRSISLIFDGGEQEVRLPDEDDPNSIDTGDRPRVRRLGGGVSFGRPLGGGWRASVGFQYQNVAIQDEDGELSPVDALGNQLSFSGTGRDDLFLFQASASRDRRNDPIAPTSGSFLRFSTDQSVPLGQGSIFLTRLRGSYSYYVPVNFTNFTDGPETLAFNVQAGTVLGDLPPYEAFSLGGTDSVRGYDSGELGSGRSFLQATAEYRFPIFSIVGGALFVDFGTDLGTADDVPGSPAEVRDKPGSGFGVGLGVRVRSPIGQIRVDYAVNDEGDGRIHFGIGERF
ncbi:BamA/TamA family outer membrane protein [Oscillatoria sp. FACHB-1407]|uniref:BamA/TamA family outer membrane protein n=2 Tax=Oscillatoria sp. FACHB-1407 TaxID=2692847 RepID=UPI0035CD33A6